MSVDEPTRLRIRRYLTDLMEEESANAIMESMPPIPWTDLATKDDIAALTLRFDSTDRRMDGLGERIDGLTDRVETLARAVVVGALTMAVMPAVFIAGTVVSLIIAGAFA